jgi:hypothetical protein
MRTDACSAGWSLDGVQRAMMRLELEQHGSKQQTAANLEQASGARG